MLLRKLRYRVILQYLKYTIFRKLIVPYDIFKILLLIAVAPSFLCTFRIAHRILGTKKTRASAGSAAWQCNHSYHDMQIFTYVKYFFGIPLYSGMESNKRTGVLRRFTPPRARIFELFFYHITMYSVGVVWGFCMNDTSFAAFSYSHKF